MTINNLITTNIQEALNSEKKLNLFQVNHRLQEKYYFNKFQLSKLKKENIFHINTIKSTCIDYRLRFLDMKYFKGEIPLEAIEKIKQMEIDHNKKLNSFKIMAPSIMFRLKKTDDPLLFIPIGSKRSFGQMTVQEKNIIAHRSIAVFKLVNFLTNLYQINEISI